MATVHITEQMYDLLWEAMNEEILDSVGEEMVSIDREIILDDDTYLRLQVRLMLFWETWEEPEGRYHRLADLIPTWWELESCLPDRDGEPEEFPNDANFKVLRNKAYEYYAA